MRLIIQAHSEFWIELSGTATQDIQGRYRLENGKVLPTWKLVSDAIELYGRNINKKSSLPHPPQKRGPELRKTLRASLAQT